jgi:acetate---CoA ligase (ADP-forming)
MDPLPTLDRSHLGRLFAPKTVAFIGASDKSAFSSIAFDLMRQFGSAGRTYLINPNRPEVHGTRTYASCADVPGGFDCAYVLVPQRLVEQAIDDAAAAGARAAVVITAGFAELGPSGMRAQRALVQRCQSNGMVLLGPNHLGFASVGAGIAVCALPGISPQPGRLALVSQSGALAGTLTQFARAHGITFSYAVTTGNEAMVTAEDVVDYVLDDPLTKAVSVFAETIRKPEVFLRAVRKAGRLGKAIVMLKAGSSVLSARTAAAHTGALVGDDAVIDALLRQEGVIRVAQLEELLITGHLAAHTGVWPRPGVAVASLSGGACDVIADRAQDLALPVPELDPATTAALERTISALGHAHNPLDVTGAAMTDHDLLGNVTAVLASDPNVGFVAVVGGPDPSLPGVGRALSQASVPGAFVSTVTQALSGATAAAVAAAGLTYIPGTRDAITAMAHISRWSGRIAQLREPGDMPRAPLADLRVRPGEAMSEAEVRALLERAGVPVVPSAVATTADEAVRAAERWPGPVAMKIVSRDIEHKSDIGGVRLGVRGAEEVRAAFGQIVAAGRAVRPGPRIDGVLISPMRAGGTELLVGVARDPDWGLVLAVAIGGVFVEVLRDSSLLHLPSRRADILRAVERLRGAALLRGARGGAEADLDALADVIQGIADLALMLGEDLQALEVNPLRVAGSEIEALDGLVEWRER